MRTSIDIYHIFLLNILHRNNLHYSKFQHKLLHTGKGLISWLELILVFLLALPFPESNISYLCLKSIRHSHSYLLKANPKIFQEKLFLTNIMKCF